MADQHAGHRFVQDVTAENFETAVIDRSVEVPVVVDFWAPWCGPCRQLAPVLEHLADEYAGQFVLAKVNVDEQPSLAAAFRVQSIPHVVAIRNKQLLDQFLGVLPESQLRNWLERILPSPADALVQEGAMLEMQNPVEAEGRYRAALELAPDHPAAAVALIRILLAQGKADEARSVLEQLEARGFLEPDAERLKAQMEVEAGAEASGGLDAARQAVDADPGNLELKVALADALAASRRYAEALDLCLDVIRQDKTGAGVQAKEAMLNILSLMDDQPELASEYRRKLASALY